MIFCPWTKTWPGRRRTRPRRVTRRRSRHRRPFPIFCWPIQPSSFPIRRPPTSTVTIRNTVNFVTNLIANWDITAVCRRRRRRRRRTEGSRPCCPTICNKPSSYWSCRIPCRRRRCRRPCLETTTRALDITAIGRCSSFFLVPRGTMCIGRFARRYCWNGYF